VASYSITETHRYVGRRAIMVGAFSLQCPPRLERSFLLGLVSRGAVRAQLRRSDGVGASAWSSAFPVSWLTIRAVGCFCWVKRFPAAAEVRALFSQPAAAEASARRTRDVQLATVQRIAATRRIAASLPSTRSVWPARAAEVHVLAARRVAVQRPD
jgi:hypothetical protein